MNAVLCTLTYFGSFVIFQGILISIAKYLDIFVIFQGPDPLSPHLNPRMDWAVPRLICAFVICMQQVRVSRSRDATYPLFSSELIQNYEQVLWQENIGSLFVA